PSVNRPFCSAVGESSATVSTTARSAAIFIVRPCRSSLCEAGLPSTRSERSLRPSPSSRSGSRCDPLRTASSRLRTSVRSGSSSKSSATSGTSQAGGRQASRRTTNRSVHVLEADAQVIPAGHQRQYRRAPQGRQPHRARQVGFDVADQHGPPGQCIPENQRAERHELEGGFPFGELAHRNRNLQATEEFAQAGHRDLANQDDQPCDDVCVADVRPAQHALRGQDQDHRGDHDLVGNRVEKHAQFGDGAARPREVAVEVVGDPHQAVEGEGETVAELPVRPPEQESEQRHREDARQGQQVRQRQHGPCLALRRVGKKCASRLFLSVWRLSRVAKARGLLHRHMFTSTHLLRQRRFLPLFATQLLNAFNDNLFKNAMVLFVVYSVYNSEEAEAQFSAIASGLFILPFFVLSAMSGQLADMRDKAFIIRCVKLAEIFIMLVGAAGLVMAWQGLLTHTVAIPLMLAALFAMGVHSTFFGPIKYAILPQHLEKDEVLAGTGLVEAGTYLAILAGTILAGYIDVEWAALGVVLTALVGYATSRQVPPAPPYEHGQAVDWHLIRSSIALVRNTMHLREVFYAILAISFFWTIGAVLFIQFPPLAKNVLFASKEVASLFLVIFSIGVAIGSVAINALLKGDVSARHAPLSVIAMGGFVAVFWFLCRQWSVEVTDRGLMEV